MTRAQAVGPTRLQLSMLVLLTLVWGLKGPIMKTAATTLGHGL